MDRCFDWISDYWDELVLAGKVLLFAATVFSIWQATAQMFRGLDGVAALGKERGAALEKVLATLDGGSDFDEAFVEYAAAEAKMQKELPKHLADAMVGAHSLNMQMLKLRVKAAR